MPLDFGSYGGLEIVVEDQPVKHGPLCIDHHYPSPVATMTLAMISHHCHRPYPLLASTANHDWTAFVAKLF